VLEGGQEDRVVHVIVAGEGGGEPDGHLFEGLVRFGVVGGGEYISAIDGEPSSLGPLGMRGPNPLHEPDKFRFDLCPVVVGDVEAGGLSMILLESFGADQDSGVVAVVAAAVAATAAAASWGLVLLVLLELFDSILGLEGPAFGIVCPKEVGSEALMKEAEGGGEVLGIVQEDLAVPWSGGLEHHCCSARGEGVGEWGLDEFGDVVAVGVFVNDAGLFVDSGFSWGNITSVRHAVSLFVIVDGDVGFGGGEHNLFHHHGGVGNGGGGVEGGEESIFRSHHSAGDGSDVFNADESVGHCDFWLVEEVVEEASLFVGDVTG
jgi:hypothetical protein